MNSIRDNINDEFIKVIAQQNQMHVLPDSTKVWMESGSSIKYTKAFNKKREVWLEGNSFFEVYKHEGSFFQVHINKAFIEVKGTCFQIKQTNAEKNEITLFHGKIEFNVESTGEKIIMSPSQKVMYGYQLEGRKIQLQRNPIIPAHFDCKSNIPIKYNSRRKVY